MARPPEVVAPRVPLTVSSKTPQALVEVVAGPESVSPLPASPDTLMYSEFVIRRPELIWLPPSPTIETPPERVSTVPVIDAPLPSL